MEEGYQHSDWYDQSLPPEAATEPVAAAPACAAPQRRRKRPGVKPALISVCVLLLVVASAYAFSDRGTATQSDPGIAWGIPPVPSQLPRSGEGGGTERGSGGDDDFRSFFDEYYSGSASGSLPSSEMERATGLPAFTVRLVSSEDREALTLQELYHRNIDSIVGIKATQSGSSGYAWGTGVVLSANGFILTNQHVIAEANNATVVLSDGTEYAALLVGEDTQTDIAVLKIEARGLSPAEFGDSAALAVGDGVAAIGNPLGNELTGTMTDGIISAIDRDIQVNGRRMTLLQTNAAINEGNSGGPLINMYGQVVGITNMKMVRYYSQVTVEGIGFAIPSVTVKAVADQLIAHGTVAGRPGLGVTLGSIPDEAAERFSFLPEGLYVYSVSENSDAAAKGLLPGDIVTHVNGQEVRTTDEVLEIRDTLSVGDVMVLTVWRDGTVFDLPVELLDLNNLY